jgi:hypothetical protein
MRLKRIAPKKAAEKLRILNPGTSEAVSASIIALITNVKMPKDKICKGNVKNEKIGLIRVLITPQTKAAKSADEMPLS